MEERRNITVNKKIESKDDVILLFMNLQEQTNLLLEEVINDNRILKQEVNNLRNLVIRYETVQKEIDEIIFERRECQKEVKLKLAEASLSLEGIKEKVSADKTIASEKFDNKCSDIYAHVNKEIMGIVKEVSMIKIEAARQGAKYAVIVSIATFIILTIVGVIIHWIEKKFIIP